MNAPIVVQVEMNQVWRYAACAEMARFCAGLKQRRIEAMRCGGCARRYLPPRPFCGNCHLRLTEWVPVSHEGVLDAWTVVHLPILDGRTGTTRDAPYGMGLIRLDGADTTINHYLDLNDAGRLAVGLRVRAVWRDRLEGAIDDIRHFEVLP